MAGYAYNPKSRGELTPHVATDIGAMAGVNASGGPNADTLNRGFENERIAGTPSAAWGEGENPYQDDVDRYRKLGWDKQPAVTLNQGQADQSRGMQMGALGLMRAQANGSAPSSAGILANRANETAAMNATRAATATKSAGAGIVAAGAAADAATGSRGVLAQNAANAGQRLGEISSGQTGLASGAVGAQGQDTSAATINAQFEARQRALNERKQQGYERMAFDTTHSRLQNEGEARRQIRGNEAAQREIDAAADAESRDAPRRSLSAPVGFLMGGIKSDVRAKTRVHTVDVGSLSSLTRGR